MADGDFLGMQSGHQVFSPVPQSSVTGLEAALAAAGDGTLLLTADQKAALDAANSPNDGNPVATMADVPALPLTAATITYDAAATGGGEADAQAALDRALTVLAGGGARRNVFEGLDPSAGTIVPAAGDIWLQQKTGGGNGFLYRVRNLANDAWVTAFSVLDDGSIVIGDGLISILPNGDFYVATGSLEATFAADGSVTFNGNGIVKFNRPTSDPAVAGADWVNAGVVMVSAG